MNLLERLDRAIANARDPRLLINLHAERAMQLARKCDGARLALDVQWLEHASAPELRELADLWRKVVMGTQDHYMTNFLDATATFDGILALPELPRWPEVHAMAAAWAAHMHGYDERPERCLDLVQTVLRMPLRPNHPARLRAVVVLAWLTTYSSMTEASAQWNQRARQLAMKVGDDETLSALMFNMALMRCVNLVVDFCWGAVAPEELRRAVVMTETVVFLDRSLKVQTWPVHAQALRARALWASMQFAGALDLFNAARSAGQGEDKWLDIFNAHWGAERALCLLREGHAQEAHEAAIAAFAAFDHVHETGDKAISAYAAFVVFEAVGDRERAVLAEAASVEYLVKHRARARLFAMDLESRRFEQYLGDVTVTPGVEQELA